MMVAAWWGLTLSKDKLSLWNNFPGETPWEQTCPSKGQHNLHWRRDVQGEARPFGIQGSLGEILGDQTALDDVLCASSSEAFPR